MRARKLPQTNMAADAHPDAAWDALAEALDALPLATLRLLATGAADVRGIAAMMLSRGAHLSAGV